MEQQFFTIRIERQEALFAALAATEPVIVVTKEAEQGLQPVVLIVPEAEV